jgi:hypothetical protein
VNASRFYPKYPIEEVRNAMAFEILPFGAQFAETPHIEHVEMPAYDPESQISAGESYAPCYLTDTFCSGYCCDPYGHPCTSCRYICDDDTQCGY